MAYGVLWMIDGAKQLLGEKTTTTKLESCNNVGPLNDTFSLLCLGVKKL